MHETYFQQTMKEKAWRIQLWNINHLVRYLAEVYKKTVNLFFFRHDTRIIYAKFM